MINDIVTLITTIGEIVGRVKDFDDKVIVLDNPRLFMHNGETAGFAPGICMTGVNNPESITFNQTSVLAVIKSDPEAAKAWVQATSGIVLTR